MERKASGGVEYRHCRHHRRSLRVDRANIWWARHMCRSVAYPPLFEVQCIVRAHRQLNTGNAGPALTNVIMTTAANDRGFLVFFSDCRIVRRESSAIWKSTKISRSSCRRRQGNSYTIRGTSPIPVKRKWFADSCMKILSRANNFNRWYISPRDSLPK